VPSCCRAGPCEEMFKPKVAQRSLHRYRKKGLDEIERGMVSSVSADELDGARILEIGGGIGTIQAELLEAGAERGEIVELVSAYGPYAQELAREKGLEGRTSFRVADLLEQPDAVAPADVVVLNRVVCCSAEGVTLTGVAAHLAERVLVISVPRDRFWVRPVIRLMNGALWLMRRSFRVFMHPRESLVAAAEAEGLRLADSGHGRAWEFLVLRRAL